MITSYEIKLSFDNFTKFLKKKVLECKSSTI